MEEDYTAIDFTVLDDHVLLLLGRTFCVAEFLQLILSGTGAIASAILNNVNLQLQLNKKEWWTRVQDKLAEMRLDLIPKEESPQPTESADMADGETPAKLLELFLSHSVELVNLLKLATDVLKGIGSTDMEQSELGALEQSLYKLQQVREAKESELPEAASLFLSSLRALESKDPAPATSEEDGPPITASQAASDLLETSLGLISETRLALQEAERIVKKWSLKEPPAEPSFASRKRMGTSALGSGEAKEPDSDFASDERIDTSALDGEKPVSHKQTVYYATNRVSAKGHNGGSGSGNKLHYLNDAEKAIKLGTAEVIIPLVNKNGKRRRSGAFPPTGGFEFFHMYIEAKSVSELPEDEFHASIGESLAQGQGELLLFIHGYNVPFEAAVQAVAFMAHEAEFKGPVMALDWASCADRMKYSEDRSRVTEAHEGFGRVLERLISKLQAFRQPTAKRLRKVHVIAHSMGNYMFQKLVDDLTTPTTPPGSSSVLSAIGTCIFAAPDVKRSDLENTLSSLQKVPFLHLSAESGSTQPATDATPTRSRSLTLYCCVRDVALWASGIISWSARAGFFKRFLPGKFQILPYVFNPDLLTVRVPVFSAGDITGHGYYNGSPMVVKDIGNVVNGNSEPKSERDLLVWDEKNLPSHPRGLWSIRAAHPWG